MATVVAFGLTLSTMVTLVLIPVMYTLLDGWINTIKRRFKRNLASAQQSEASASL
jgi:HAE1 family hydrophobic/amphiphilic exporter-1